MNGVEVKAAGSPYLTTAGQLVVPVNVTNNKSTNLDLNEAVFTVVLENGTTVNAYCTGAGSIAPGQTASLLVAVNSPVIINITVINIVQNNQYVNCTVPSPPKVVPVIISTLDHIKAAGKIVMWTEATFRPFESYDSNTMTYYGFDIDLANRITENVSAHLGVPISLEIQDKAFSSIPAGIQSNQSDMSLSGMTITAARNQSVLFSVPYYNAQVGYGMMVRSSNNDLNSPDDLMSASSIVVCTGTTSELWVQENLIDKGYPADKVKSLPTIAGCVQDVQIGQSEVFIIDKPTVDYYVEQSSSQLRDAGTIQDVASYAVAMNHYSNDLKAIVDQVITNMQNDGEMHALMVKWGLA